jgi:hypothetical protein
MLLSDCSARQQAVSVEVERATVHLEELQVQGFCSVHVHMFFAFFFHKGIAASMCHSGVQTPQPFKRIFSCEGRGMN